MPKPLFVLVGDDVRMLAEANSLLGRIEFERGRSEAEASSEDWYEAAEGHFRRAAELFATEQNETGVGRVLASIGRLFIEQGRLPDAISELRKALHYLRGDIDIRLDFAWALLLAGQHQAALAEYTFVLDVAPENVTARLGRAQANVERGDAPSALSDIDEAIRRQPELASRTEVVSLLRQVLDQLEGQA